MLCPIFLSHFKGDCLVDDKGFEFDAPTTRRNALRVLRAMQLVKPGTYFKASIVMKLTNAGLLLHVSMTNKF